VIARLDAMSLLKREIKMIGIKSFFTISIVAITILLFHSSVYSQDCKWTDKELGIHDLKNIQKQMDALMDWPSEKCEQYIKIMEEYKNCYCKVIANELEEFKKNLREFLKKHPDWRGKKVCYKEDEFTSINIRLDSYELIANRCSTN
jgi:hypothetical protein